MWRSSMFGAILTENVMDKGLACLLAVAAPGLPEAGTAQGGMVLKSFPLDDPAPAAEFDEIVDCLLTPESCDSAEFKPARGLTLDDVRNLVVIDRQAEPDTPLPTIDLEVLFAHASDALTPQARDKLNSPATALRDPHVQEATLVFVGHTDAVGSAAYNRALSQRRADSVARHIRDTLQVPEARIRTVGVGFDRPKNEAVPEAAENRRVQLVLVPDT